MSIMLLLYVKYSSRSPCISIYWANEGIKNIQSMINLWKSMKLSNLWKYPIYIMNLMSDSRWGKASNKEVKNSNPTSGWELDDLKIRLKSGIFKCISWLNCLGVDDDRGFLQNGVKTYLMTQRSPLNSPSTFFLSSYLHQSINATNFLMMRLNCMRTFSPGELY